jgi:hypothetical protein
MLDVMRYGCKDTKKSPFFHHNFAEKESGLSFFSDAIRCCASPGVMGSFFGVLLKKEGCAWVALPVIFTSGKTFSKTRF